MSRFRGNDDECPHCGIKYGAFRTGLTFNEIVSMLWCPDEDARRWRYRRRGTILGYWHMVKQEYWKHHIRDACPEIGVEVPF